MISVLLKNLPDWAQLNRSSCSAFIIAANPKKASGLLCRTTFLKVSFVKDRIIVSELHKGSILPKACPERHINADSTFCIGLSAGIKITTNLEAKVWWDHLAKFLICQEFAEQHKRWPPGKGLCHGRAAFFQIEAEVFAEKLGLLQEYRDAIEHQIGWLSGALPRFADEEKRLLNGRMRCPNFCKRKCGKVLLRRQCHKSNDIYGLIKNESLRRVEEQKFIDQYKKSGFICCGTMHLCPFK